MDVDDEGDVDIESVKSEEDAVVPSEEE